MTLATLEVLVDAPDAFAPRAAWALDTLLAPLGRRAEVQRDPARSGGAALAYARDPVDGVPTIPCSAEAIELFAAGRALPPGAFRRTATSAGDVAGAFPCGPSVSRPDPVASPAGACAAFAAPFDLVASAFALLACWDEHTSGERDRFGRLPYQAGVFAANPELRIEEPAVDGYVALLRRVLGPRLAELGLEPLPEPGWMWRGANDDGPPGGPPRFAVALTHDIDNVWRWTPRGFAATGYRSARALRHLDWGALRREFGDLAHWLTVHLPRRSDPYWTFPSMLEGEDERGVASTFYVIARHTHRRDGNQPKTYQRRLPEILALLKRHGREVGLHGNDSDRLGADPLRDDRDLLAQRARTEVHGIRYHYLRCLYHETLPLLEQAGFSYDTSLAFAEHEGYRCGCSFPFRPYYLAKERPLDLVELPLALMDTGLQGAQYRALGAAEARETALAVLEHTRAAGGGAALLWHNLRFDPRSARGYDDLYWELVRWVADHAGLAAPAGEIVARWRVATGMPAADVVRASGALTCSARLQATARSGEAT